MKRRGCTSNTARYVEKKLSSREKVLNFVIKYMEEHQYSPSIRDICDGVGLKSTSSVYAHLVNLEMDGEIEFNGVRCIAVKGYRFGKI